MWRILLLLVAELSGLQAAPQPARVAGLISGVTRNAWSKAGVSRVMLQLSTTTNPPLDAITYSDENGAFAFTRVPPGEYYLCAEVKSYQRVCYGATASGEPVPKLQLRTGESRQDIAFELLPLGTVSGTVLDRDGDPVPNAEVRMLQAIYLRRTLHWRSMGQAGTNERGEYRLPFVAPGKYRFLAMRRYLPVVGIQPEATYGQTPAVETYGTQFYPGAQSVQAAADVTLGAGNDVKAIDFTLSAAPQTIISGKVMVPPDLGPEVQVNLALITQSLTGGMDQLGGAAGPPDYRFQFPGVSSGDYVLIAFLKTKEHAYRTVQTISTGSGTEDLTVPLEPGTPLSGTLKIEGTAADNLSAYKVVLIPGDELPGTGEFPAAQVNADGTFHFPEVEPGIWDIGLEPIPPGSYLKSMLLGSKDVLTADMVLAPGTRPSLDLTLDMNGATVSGQVTREDHKTGVRSMVLLVPEGIMANALSFYMLAQSDDEGRFSFRGVTPGKYKVFGFDHLEETEYWNPNFLKPLEGLAESFEVTEGSHMTRNVAFVRRDTVGVN